MSVGNHALWLAEMGRFAEGLTASEEAVRLRRELVARKRDAYLPDLAMSLTNYAARLGQAGRQTEAFNAGEEAVRLYRQLAEANPNTFLPNLATARRRPADVRGAHRQTRVSPPSMVRFDPVMKLAAGEARKATRLATSSLVPNRPVGTLLVIAATNSVRTCSGSSSLASAGVSMGPGLMALTRIFLSLRSEVQDRANERTAAFVAL